MSTIDPAIWSALEKSRLAPGQFATRIVLPELTTKLIAAVTRDHHRHFLILDPGAEAFQDDTSRGLSVQIRDLNAAGVVDGQYLDLECKEEEGHDAFDLIGSDIAHLLHNTDLRPIEIVSQVLARWRRFWGQVPRNVLSTEAVLGLFGEIWFLTNWLIPYQGSKAIATWYGPGGGRHDFQDTSGSVEVKTTTSTRGRIHQIHGIDQLGQPDNGSLHLFSLRVREEPGATNTLPGLIELCSNRLSPDPAMLDLFEQKIVITGYSPVHAEHYAQMRLRIVEESLFAVRDDFPRINLIDFGTGISPGIEKIDYIINLNNYNHLRVATIPEEVNVIGWCL